MSFNPMREFIEPDDSHADSAFDVFKNKHNKSYDDEQEHNQRKNIFTNNLRFTIFHFSTVRKVNL